MSVINCINRLPSDTTLLPPKVDDSFVCTNNLNPNTGVCAGDLGMCFNTIKAKFVEKKHNERFVTRSLSKGSSLVDGDGKIIGISSWTSVRKIHSG